MNCEYCRNNPKLEQGVHGGCVKCGAPIKDREEEENEIKWKSLLTRIHMQNEVMKMYMQPTYNPAQGGVPPSAVEIGFGGTASKAKRWWIGRNSKSSVY